MPAMLLSLVMLLSSTVTENEFRGTMGFGPQVRLAYRDLSCKTLSFDEFAAAMQQPGLTSEVVRAPDGTAATMTLHRRGGTSCPSPYGRITRMPDFDLPDLAGKRVTSAGLRGRPTLVNFYFSTCIPCILEVEPLNAFAASRKDLNFLAITFDEPAEARAFVQRFGFRWRVVPDARDFIDKMTVNRYPMMALFDAQGRLLGTRAGGVKDELEAATVGPALKRWVDSLLLGAPAP
jgi:cytochrome oxidase Cu insertion factor (SCO1/SenC/PrrC family)